jgi:hypothetical protein
VITSVIDGRDPARQNGPVELDQGPFLDDLRRRAGLGMGSAATEVAAGILLGLYNCREGSSETLLEYPPTTRPSARQRW